jgi:2-polyprenyl-3-methyl-5-hydroxy-6-metoxy-1,4-benzoquinol methylase
MKFIEKQNLWNAVLEELEQETLKLAAYDHSILPMLNKEGSILDYGCGPGVLAKTLSEKGFMVKTYDISKDMREQCSDKIGTEHVFNTPADIPKNHFDSTTCNLVLCIVSKEEVTAILQNIRSALKPNGTAYIGFCNPKIFDARESALDFRKQSDTPYDTNHSFIKIKKEGNYEIVENHRPIEWYENTFAQNGFSIQETTFTQEYELKNRRLQDFVIFTLRKNGA